MGKRVIAVVMACVAASLWPSEKAYSQTNPITTGSLTIELHNIATLPTGTTGAPDFLTVDGVPGDSRLFAVGQSGQIRIISGGTLQTTPFFDASTALGGNLIAGDERGLLGLAFPPDFSNVNSPEFHKVYTFTSEKPAGNAPNFINPEMALPGYVDSAQTQTVIREWTVNAANSAINTSAGSRVLMRVEKPQTNHNGGTLAFGPDGYLYITLGDGGGADDNNGSPTLTNDGHSNSVNGGPPGNAQDINVVYGKILRIDPTKPNLQNAADPANDPNSIASANGQYQIPKNNPFALDSTGANKPGVDEIYAYGLRNPYRISFDKVTGKLFAADVGQGQREEIDSIVKGGNYGWVLKEGTLTNGDIGGPYTTPPNLIAPIGEYTHANGTATIGGYVSRNPFIPSLYGQYVFGDLGGANNGQLFYMGINDPGPNTIFKFKISDLGAQVPSADLHGFGQDTAGNIYAVFANGQIMQIAPLLGDVNRDFQLTNTDIQALIGAIASPSAYEAAHNNMSAADFLSIADINGDGQANGADVSALMKLLAGNAVGSGGGETTAVPEPATLLLMVLGYFCVLLTGNLIKWQSRAVCAELIPAHVQNCSQSKIKNC